jgi:hypothetical protein
MFYKITNNVQATQQIPTIFNCKRKRLTEKQKSIVREKCNNVCNICKKQFPLYMYEYDHIVPLMHGGLDHYDYMQILCIKCHQEKTNKERNRKIKIPDIINSYNIGSYLYEKKYDYLDSVKLNSCYKLDIQNELYIDIISLIEECNYHYILNDIKVLLLNNVIDYLIIDNNTNYPAIKLYDFIRYICCKEKKCMDDDKRFELCI